MSNLNLVMVAVILKKVFTISLSSRSLLTGKLEKLKDFNDPGPLRPDRSTVDLSYQPRGCHFFEIGEF